MEQRIFDVHVHIYPENIARKATDSISAFYSEFDVHAKGIGTIDDCIKRMDAAGTTKCAVHSVAVHPGAAENICNFIMQAYEAHPERIVPFATMHPEQTDPEEFAERMRNRGFKGFKIHPDMQGFRLDSDEAESMMQAIEKTGLPLLIHCGDKRYDLDGPRRVMALHDRHPELKLIAAHFGGWMQWDEALKILPGHGITVDMSSTFYCYSPEEAADMIRKYGVRNILYGTDYPMWDPVEEFDRFMRIDLSDSEREDILWNNAADLFCI